MRLIITFTLLALALYAAFSVMLYLLQERLVFLPHMPGRALEADPASIGLAFFDAHIETADGETLHGWSIPANNPRGTVLFFHCNAGNISHRLDSILIFNRLGMNQLIIDYRGYGQSSGKPSEQGTYKDAEAAWNYLVNELQASPDRIVIFGRSLGGSVAAWLTSQETVKPAGLVIESSFSSGVEMGRRLYPVLPVRLITRIKYPTKDYVAVAGVPLLVAHSRDDEIIPFDMGQAIFESAPEPKRFLELSGDHNAGFWISRNEYIPALDDFFSEVLSETHINPNTSPYSVNIRQK